MKTLKHCREIDAELMVFSSLDLGVPVWLLHGFRHLTWQYPLHVAPKFMKIENIVLGNVTAT